jgi:hypothetical protein
MPVSDQACCLSQVATGSCSGNSQTQLAILLLTASWDCHANPASCRECTMHVKLLASCLHAALQPAPAAASLTPSDHDDEMAVVQPRSF